MYIVHSISEIPHSVEIRWIEVSGKDHAREILEKDGYSTGWFYGRKDTKRLIVDKREYQRINGDQ